MNRILLATWKATVIAFRLAITALLVAGALLSCYASTWK